MVSTLTEYAARRHKMITHLGGVCVVCGTSENLHIDHIDASTKEFDISKNWARAWETLLPELDKCQLLCPPHHKKKTRKNAEHNGGHNKWEEIKHGTVWAYSRYKCRCTECKAAKAADYQARKNRGVGELGTPLHLG